MMYEVEHGLAYQFVGPPAKKPFERRALVDDGTGLVHDGDGVRRALDEGSELLLAGPERAFRLEPRSDVFDDALIPDDLPCVVPQSRAGEHALHVTAVARSQPDRVSRRHPLEFHAFLECRPLVRIHIQCQDLGSRHVIRPVPEEVESRGIRLQQRSIGRGHVDGLAGFLAQRPLWGYFGPRPACWLIYPRKHNGNGLAVL